MNETEIKKVAEIKDTTEVTRAKWLALFALLVVLFSSVVLDQVTKFQAQENLMIWSDDADVTNYRGRGVPVLAFGDEGSGHPSRAKLYFGLNYVRNQGAAWGALSNLDDKYRVPFFYCVTFIAVLIIALYMRATPHGMRLQRYALTLILSGAIGNFIDRVRLDYVIDWIDVRWNFLGWRYNFPNFNIADSAISVGVFFLLIEMIVLEPLRNRKAAKKKELPANEEC